MSGPERSVPTAVVRVSLRQSRRVLQCSRRGVKVSHEIGHLALHDTLVAGRMASLTDGRTIVA